MLERQLAEMSDNVLHLGVVYAAVLAAEISETGDLVEQVVCDGDEDENTDRVRPDDDHGDDIGVSVTGLHELRHWGWERLLVDVGVQPSENTEESGNDVDTSNGANELPGWKSLSTTGDEDEPVLSKGDFEEQDFLNVAPVLHNTTRWQVHCATDDPSCDCKFDTEDDRDDPDLGQLPFDRLRVRVRIVVSDGNGSQIGKEGDEDNELGADGLVDDDHGGNQVDFQVKAEGNTVLDVCLHTLENLAGSLDGKDNSGETWGKENDIGGGLGSFGGTFDGDTTIGLLERWSIVDTVTSHGSQVTTLLQHLDDLVLVFGENFSETIGTLDEIVLSGTGQTTVDELLRVVDLGSEGKHLASLLGDGDSITSQHLDWDTELLSLDDGLGGIFTRRVEHREHTKEDPRLVILLVGDTEGTETTAGEFSSLLLEEICGFARALGEVEDSLGCTLGAGETVAAESADGGDTLGHGVKRSEFLGLPVILQDVTSLGVALEGQDGDLVDGVERLDVVRRRESSASHHPVDILAFGDVRLTDGELVSSESTSLVRAEHIDTGKGLDSSKLLYDGLLLGEVGSTDSQGGGCDDRQTDGNTNNEQDQDVFEESVVRVFWSSELEVAEETTNPGSENPEHDENQESRTDAVHDGLEVTLILGALDEHSSATDERVLCGGSGNGVGLSTLATSGVVDNISHELVDGERLSSDGRLISGNDGVTLVSNALALVTLGILRASWVLFWVQSMLLAQLLVLLEVLWVFVVANETSVGGADLTFLNDDNVTGDDLASLDLLFLTITNDGCLHGNVTLEFCDNISSLFFLVPTNDGVEHKNGDNDTEIDPITKTGGEEDSKFHDCTELADILQSSGQCDAWRHAAACMPRLLRRSRACVETKLAEKAKPAGFGSANIHWNTHPNAVRVRCA